MVHRVIPYSNHKMFFFLLSSLRSPPLHYTYVHIYIALSLLRYFALCLYFLYSLTFCLFLLPYSLSYSHFFFPFFFLILFFSFSHSIFLSLFLFYVFLYLFYFLSSFCSFSFFLLLPPSVSFLYLFF